MTGSPVPLRVLLGGILVAATLVGCATSDPAARSIGGGLDGSAEALPEGPVVIVGDADPIAVEVADTAEARRTGLMGRADVPAGTGMLFVYDEPVVNAFWMGNVEVPLSIAWVLGDEVVGIAEMQPCPAADDSCPRYSPGVEYDRAVETAGGAFTEAGIAPGDPVEFVGIDPRPRSAG